jgi:hypothetical protein
MKKVKFIFGLVLLLVVAVSCNVEGINNDTALAGANPEKLSKIFDISTDNSGKVKITPSAEGATSFKVDFGHGTGNSASAIVTPASSTNHVYPEGKYVVKIAAISISGAITEQSFPLEVVYRAPEDVAVVVTQSAHNVKVKATAKYASSCLVYFGDMVNEVGTLTPIDAEVTHDYALGGTYNLRIVALSGGVAKTEKTTPIVVFDPLVLPYTCELTSQNYLAGGTFGGVNYSIIANPFSGGLNTSANVVKFEKPVNAEEWAGTWKPFDVAIDFSKATKIKMLVYVTEAGKKVGIELQNSANGAPNTAIFAATTVANQWEELVFDTTTNLDIPVGATYKQLNINYNRPNKGLGEVIYIDNIRVTN